jgi:hypothetical protein
MECRGRSPKLADVHTTAAHHGEIVYFQRLGNRTVEQLRDDMTIPQDTKLTRFNMADFPTRSSDFDGYARQHPFHGFGMRTAVLTDSIFDTA